MRFQGFIMYFESAEPDAMELTQHHQQNGRRGQFRRSHAIFEARNFICAHIKRDDQAMRRLVQYLAMQSHRLLLLVRDAETGQLLIKPPEEERWLYREKSGLGRASKNEFHIIKSIGPEFFEQLISIGSGTFRSRNTTTSMFGMLLPENHFLRCIIAFKR
jgi:hypothetical protein